MILLPNIQHVVKKLHSYTTRNLAECFVYIHFERIVLFVGEWICMDAKSSLVLN